MEPLASRLFQSLRYLRSNARRLEHLATLGLPIEGRSVLEIGAGIGDLTTFFLDRDCTVTSVEPRTENIAYFRARYAEDPLWPVGRLQIVQSDVYGMTENGVGVHDVVFVYSMLSFVDQPQRALRVMADLCRDLLVIETPVDSGARRDEDVLRVESCSADDLRSSITGQFFVPTRRWLFRELGQHFAHVYMTRTQPYFDRFRLDWRRPSTDRPQDRIVVVASRAPLDNPLLSETILDVQHRG